MLRADLYCRVGLRTCLSRPVSRVSWAGAVVVSVALLVCPAAQAQQEVAGTQQSEEKDEATPEEREKSAEEEREELKQKVATLEAELADLAEKIEEDELEKIVAEAEAEARAPEEEEKPEDRKFLWGALALQKLNPELSVCGDFVAGLIIDKDANFYAGADDRSMFGLREAGLHLQHVLDPYSMFKAAVHFAPEPHPDFELEEMYITWFGIVPSLSFTLGRFRQDFGVINRWHGHDLDQVEHPLAMTLVLGEHGLNQTGLAIKWFMPPLWAHANEFTVEVTNAENETLFAGEFFSVPAVMAHLKSFYDLSESTYMELGLTGMHGTNNKRGYIENDQLEDEPWRHTLLGGVDLTVQWNPPQRARYRSFTWRTEGYLAKKETKGEESFGFLDDFEKGIAERDGDRVSWGAYSYVDYQLGPRWFAGVRGDIAMPTIRVEDEIAWDVVPYITFWQSEFVYLRLEYRHGRNIPYTRPDGMSEEVLSTRTDNRILLQVNWAAGPHKHEKY